MTFRSSLWLIAGLVLAGGAVPATAQLSGPSSGWTSAPREASEDDYWFMLRQMGDCLASSKPGESGAFLAAKIDSTQETRAFGRLFGKYRNMCMRNFVSASILRAHIRGVVAEGMYRRNLRALPSTFAPAVEVPPTIGSIHDFANCYVAANFTGVKDFLATTKLATDDESERLADMAPTFAPCLPKGRDVTLKAINVRMALAEAMYHATNPLRTPTRTAR